VIDAAVETCFWPLYEVIDGRYRLSYEPRHAPVEEWLGSQERFAHLFRPENAELIRQIQEQVDSDWTELIARCDSAPPAPTDP
jgi:pyruvate ferredoxin oxidoreductase beta subunit